MKTGDRKFNYYLTPKKQINLLSLVKGKRVRVKGKLLLSYITDKILRTLMLRTHLSVKSG